jgi:hypothetical protein
LFRSGFLAACDTKIKRFTNTLAGIRESAVSGAVAAMKALFDGRFAA